MRIVLFFVVFVCLMQTTLAQAPIPGPCGTNPVYRQFDFWIGNWDVFALNGKKAGESRIERLLDSCVIQENWTSAQGGYSGKSYNTYNAVSGKWEQYWVDNKGGVTNYTDGHFENGKMIFLTPDQQQPNGTYKKQRLTFYHLSDDHVRQHGESSVNGGKTWKTDYDLSYKRKQ